MGRGLKTKPCETNKSADVLKRETVFLEDTNPAHPIGRSHRGQTVSQLIGERVDRHGKGPEMGVGLGLGRGRGGRFQ